MFTTQIKTTQSKTSHNNTKSWGIIRKTKRSLLHLFVVAALGAFALAQQPAKNPAQPAPARTAAPRTAGRGNMSVPREAITGPQKLPLRRVVLYKSGVGYFEHVGRVSGNEDVEIDLTSSQLNDVLKSLTALDMNGGRIVGASYNSQEPAGHQLESLPIPVANKTNLSDLLQALRGARIEVRSASGIFTGRVLGVEKVQRPSGNLMMNVDRVNLIGEGGEVRQVLLEQGTNVRFVDRDMEQQLERAMGLLDASHQEDTRRLILSTTGTGERTVRVSYISEVPVWKTTYRIVLPDRADRKPLLQGWAVVDNTVGEDWENVELSLAAGAPQSFIQDLSQPLYMRRPVVGLPQAYQLTPQLHGSTLVMNNSGPTAGLSGVVLDPSGRVIVGATVRVFDSNNSQVAAVNSGASGEYAFVGIRPGNYYLEFTAPNFKTMKMTSVEVIAGRTFNSTANLEVGAASVTVNVTASGQQVLETQNTSVRSNTRGGPRNSTFEGLPRGSINTTFDGINVQDNLLKSSDGFFALNDPRTDAVNEFGLTANAMESSVNAAAGGLLGDLFEYRLRDRVTIRKNQSALVPIAQTEIQAEKVALWSASLGMVRPLRALWLKNSSELVLDGGSFNVIEDGAFAGEGIMATLHPGERRLISYAADLAMQVVPKQEGAPEKVTKIHVSRGVLYRTVQSRQRLSYTIRNEDTVTRMLILEHPVRSGWKLAENIKPDEESATAYRFRVEVPAKETKTFVVEETTPAVTAVQLTNLDENTVKLFVSRHELTPELEKALRDILAQKEAIAQMDQEMEKRNDQIDEIGDDQDRLRENMKTLKGSPEEKALLQRYVGELNDEETKLATLRKEIADLEAKKKQAQEDMNKTIEKMAFDVKL